jgi:hypothetical protein
MKIVASIIAGTALVASLSVGASAQNAVRPQWNYQGSAVCPNGFDYYASEGLCIARGGYGGGGNFGRPAYNGRPQYGGGGYAGNGVPPTWNRQGSAVCPEYYDYHAHSGLCRPQR